MMPSHWVLTNVTLTLSTLAIFLARSMSKPMMLPCLSRISKGM